MDLLFDAQRLPLAARLRPRTLDEFFGQDQIVGPGRLLRRAIQADQLSSIILSGPPGTGKTTLARIIAARTRSQFLTMNAVLSGIKDIRTAIDQAREYHQQTNRRSILFVDEVHRWNKSQQDALLPWVEDGLFVLIGATTENPFFEVNKALLSRSRVFILQQLAEKDLEQVLDLALRDTERGYGSYNVVITDDARNHLVQTAAGDARTLLNALELAVETSVDSFPPPAGTRIEIDLSVAEDSIQQRAILYDKDGDYHFDTISAFIKSVRGSDPDAALYWLARMLEAGEDPRFIFRRLLIQASEDIGLADPSAVGVVVACASAFDRVGLPEGRFHLAQATLYLATTEKSNSTLGLFDAIASVRSGGGGEVPNHLRDANRDGHDLGHGSGYLYPHAYQDHWVAQRYLPEDLKEKVYYQGGSLGWEGQRDALTRERRLLQLSAVTEEEREIWSVSPSSTADRWTHRSSLDGNSSGQLKDILLAGIDLVPTDRVLLHGDAVQLFVWSVMKAVTAGLTAVWTDADAADTISHSIGNTVNDVYSPYVYDRAHLPDDAYPGPFEVIVHRSTQFEAPEKVLTELLPRLEPSGVLRVVTPHIRRSDGPASVLTLSDDLTSRLEETQRASFPDAETGWTAATQALNDSSNDTVGDNKFSAEIEVRDTIVTRRLDGTAVSAWLAKDSPLGSTLSEQFSPEEIETVRKAAAALETGDYPWKRSYLVITIHSSRNVRS